MRIAIVSDIHGNLSALEAVIEDLNKVGADLVLQGGDLAYGGYRPAEVVDRVRELGWRGIIGNTDEMLWAPERQSEVNARMPQRKVLRRVLFDVMAPATRERLGKDRIEWMRSLPEQLREDRLALVHASPGDLWAAPPATATDEELEEVYRPLGAEIAVYCHIHVPFIRALPRLIVANTGSVGLPFDGDPRASYLLMEDSWFTIRRVAYDVESEIAGLTKSGYPMPEWLARQLRTARFEMPPEI
jgi:putative phosphoesterase